MFVQAAEADGSTVAVWLRKVAMKAAARVLKSTDAG